MIDSATEKKRSMRLSSLPTAFGMALSVMIVHALSGEAIAAKPSFDCRKATHEIETLICRDDELAGLDKRLADTFAAANRNLSAQQRATLAATQRGWIKGRNDCWKAAEKRECAESAYRRRTVTLEAKYGLAQVGSSVYYSCEGEKNRLIFTPVKTDPPAANIVRGDDAETLIRRSSASGERYEGDFGISFSIKGTEATLEWPQGSKRACRVVK